MSVLPVGFGSSGGIDTGDIGHSLRFRGRSIAPYLSKTFGSPTSQNGWCWSGWAKFSELPNGANYRPLFAAGSVAGSTWPGELFYCYVNGEICYQASSSLGTHNITKRSTLVLRDPTSWVHIFVRKTAAANSGLTCVRIWINNVEVTTWNVNAYTGTQASVPDYINVNTVAHRLGMNFSSEHLDGYLSRVCFVDNGASLLPTDFAYLNTEINEWVSKTQAQVKAVVDAGGTNSFMLDFDDATSLTTLGYDKSSKGNNWTLNNFSLTAGTTYDHMLDVPGNSFATLNPLDKMTSTVTSADGNLKVTAGAPTYVQLIRATQAVATGKWYWEVTPISNGPQVSIGVSNALTPVGTSNAESANGWYYTGTTGNKRTNATSTAYGASYTNNDVIGVALDLDSDLITFYKNGVSQGVAWSGVFSGKTITAGIHDAANDIVANINFGQAPLHASATYDSASGGYFRYTPPTGFKALCQANLDAAGTVIVSGTFTGNASADGPCVWMNGVPKTLTINGNAVTFGTHADKLATGFKVRTSSSSYNTAGSNTWTATIDSDLQNIFKYNNAEGNP